MNKKRVLFVPPASPPAPTSSKPQFTTQAFVGSVLPTPGTLLDQLPRGGVSAVTPCAVREQVFAQFESKAEVESGWRFDSAAALDEALVGFAHREELAGAGDGLQILDELFASY